MSMAAAKRWLDQHIGEQLETVKIDVSGMRWEPGARTLAKKGATRYTLDGSTMALHKGIDVLSVDDDRIVLEWLDEDGVTISTFTYSLVTGQN